MDMMEMRFRMMAMMGGVRELWNKAVITVPSNMATSGDIYSWLTTTGVLPSFNSIFVAIRDNADMSVWNDNDLIEATWVISSSTSNPFLLRIRSPQNTNRYLQGRNPINNPTDTITVYQGETFTVFYQ